MQYLVEMGNTQGMTENRIISKGCLYSYTMGNILKELTD
jgi:hypothetical protein